MCVESGSYSEGYECECLEGFLSMPNSDTQCAGSTAPTAAPTVKPTAEPTQRPSVEPTVTPTAKPSVAPTLEPTHLPTEHPCTDGSHECDTTTTMCAEKLGDSFGGDEAGSYGIDDGYESYACVCLEGFVSMPIDDDEPSSSCVATTSPTAEPTTSPTAAPTHAPTFAPTEAPTHAPTKAPSPSPTHFPTAHPCDDGSHHCDTRTTIPVKDGAVCVCECLEGFVRGDTTDDDYIGVFDDDDEASVVDAMRTCVGTPRPTANPTYAPTAAPSAVPSVHPTHSPTDEPSASPTHEPTHLPTKIPCAHGSHDCDTETTRCEGLMDE